MLPEMTPAEISIVKSLVAVAWADGQMESSEASVVEGLLVGFDASELEEREILEWAKTPRTLETDIPVGEFSLEDKELLLSNAALLTLADGQRTVDEAKALSSLISVLELSESQAKAILSASEDGALRLSSRSLG